MAHGPYSDDAIAKLLARVKTIALVGASNNAWRPSHTVMAYLQSKGYELIPVNPGLEGTTILGAKVYARLQDVPAPVDMVDVFRNSSDALFVVREAIRLKDQLDVKAVWLQIGVRNDTAAAEAQAAGLEVVMDRCPKIEFARLTDAIAKARNSAQTEH